MKTATATREGGEEQQPQFRLVTADDAAPIGKTTAPKGRRDNGGAKSTPPAAAHQAAMVALKRRINNLAALLTLAASEVAKHREAAAEDTGDIGDGLAALAAEQIEETFAAYYTAREIGG